jgi:hypothetical protein
MTVAYADLQRFHQLVHGKRFVFAKTMPDNPHHYTLRRDWADSGEFDEAVQLIRRVGYPLRWPPTGKGRRYTYLNMNGHHYWTMGAPVDQTILINRAEHPYPSPFDAVAADYDQQFQRPKYRAEDATVMAMLTPIAPDARVLDVGAGTGLLLDHLHLPPDRYTAIEPSAGMRARFTAKHPDHEVVPCPLEPEELIRLKHITGFSKLFADTEYTQAWVSRRQIKLAREQDAPLL